MKRETLFIACERQMVDATHRLNPGHSTDFLQHFLVKISGVAAGRLFRARDANHHRQNAMWIKACIDILQREKSTDHQPGSREQHHRQSKFGAYQQTAQAVPAQSFTGAAFPFLQSIAEVDRRRSPGWRHAECHASK